MIRVFQEPKALNLGQNGRADREGISTANQGRALLGRLRELLLAQQSGLDSYLAVLDKQYEAIGRGGNEDILFYAELGEKIGRAFFSIQKVVLPLEKRYRAISPAHTQGTDVAALKAILETRKEEIRLRLKRNQDLLAQGMALLRSQIQTLKASPLRRTSVYASPGIPSCLDIRL
ncbi:MAG: flagellar biosynthesis protein FlgN [Treponema sp.]|jgi:hypothetical protein|nr:flagellar biosynthesis protein FlgN [Treponema sp.]